MFINFSTYAVLNGGGITNGGRQVGVTETVTGVESTQTGAGVNCADQENEDTGYAVSYRFLKTLVDQSVPEDEKLMVKKIRGTGNYRVEINRYVSACTDFQYEVDKTGNNYFLSIKNKYKFSEDSALLEFLWNNEDYRQYVTRDEQGEGDNQIVRYEVTGAWNSAPHDLKHELCLRSKELVNENSIDHNKASRNSNWYTRRKTFNTFTVDRGNNEESVNMYFASGVETDYVSEGDDVAENISPVPDLQCRSFEHFGGDHPYRLWTSERDKIVDRYKEACKRGDIEAMMKAQSELQDEGNFQGLLAQMNAITHELTEQKADEIFSTLEEINSELANGDLDIDEVKSLVDDYMAEVRELDRLVLDPAKRNIRENILNRRSMTKEQYEDNVKPSMEILERFGQLAGSEHSHLHNALRNNLDSESAELFTDLIREGADATAHFSAAELAMNERRAPKRNNRNTASALEHEIEAQAERVVARFESDSLRPWRLQYRAYTGDLSVVDNAQASIRALETEINRGYMAYQQEEQQAYQQSCGRNMLGMPTNSYLCQQYQSQQQQRLQRYMNERKALLLRLKTAQGEFSTLKDVYNEYYRGRVARGETTDGGSADNGFGLVALTSGATRRTASQTLPTQADGSAIEDYYNFIQQQRMAQQTAAQMQGQQQYSPYAAYMAAPQGFNNGQMMNGGMYQSAYPQMYSSPMFMQQQNPYMMYR